MQVVILAGGFGTRIAEESQSRPKPMIEIGGKPLLWHIMKGFSHFNLNEFIICAGYKQHMIKEYFANYSLHNSDITFDFHDRTATKVHSNSSEPWRVTVVDTGYDTLTGLRIKKIAPFINNKSFLLTYGDGVSDIDIKKLINFHSQHKKLCTLTATRPQSRFGYLDFAADEKTVLEFREKSQSDVGYINSGYMVLEPQVLDYIDGNVMFEAEPMQKLTRDRQVIAYKHHGFWQSMDSLRDKKKLEELWALGTAPWRIWKN